MRCQSYIFRSYFVVTTFTNVCLCCNIYKRSISTTNHTDKLINQKKSTTQVRRVWLYGKSYLDSLHRTTK